MNQGGTADCYRPSLAMLFAMGGRFLLPKPNQNKEMILMKKFLSLALLAILLLAFAACDTNDSNDTVTIGIVQMVEHPSLTLIRETFIAEMQELGYTDVNFDVRIGPGADMTALTTIAQTFVGNNVDLIVAIATPAAQAAAAQALGTDIPVVFAAASAPVAAGLVESLERPGVNVTGTSDRIDVDAIFNFALELTPGISTVGFVYNLGEVNSVSVINDAKAVLAAKGISYIEATVSSTADVQQAALSLVGNVDVIFTPIDNTVAAAMPVLAQVAIDAGIPVYTGADSKVMDGGLATVGIDYAILGAETAKLVSRLLAGASAYTEPVVTMQEFRTVVNRQTAEAIGVDISNLDAYVEIFEGR